MKTLEAHKDSHKEVSQPLAHSPAAAGSEQRCGPSAQAAGLSEPHPGGSALFPAVRVGMEMCKPRSGPSARLPHPQGPALLGGLSPHRRPRES